MDKSTLDKIKAGLICLWEKFEIDNDYLDSENNEWFEEFDQEELEVDFPDDQTHIFYSVSAFCLYHPFCRNVREFFSLILKNE